jgi:hypothetical protein
MRRGVGERMISACLFPTVLVTHYDLFRIQGTLNQHGYHSILQTINQPIWFGLGGTIICFSTGQ